MFIKATPKTPRCLVGAAAVACMLVAGNAMAGSHDVTVAIHVDATGLDLSQPAGAQELYGRVKYAAYIACTHGNRVDLVPAPSMKVCLERSLADAIRSINAPMVTQLYLSTHTVLDAAARGINVPAALAAK